MGPGARKESASPISLSHRLQISEMSTNTEDAWEKIKKGHKLPKMVFSVIGDSKSFVPLPWPKSKFQRAITQAAYSAQGCWTFYGGHDRGVSSILREAFDDYEREHFYDNKGKTLEDEKKDSTKDKNDRIRLLKIERTNNDIYMYIGDDNEKVLVTTDPDYHGFMVELERVISESKTQSFFSTNTDHGFSMRTPVLVVLLEGDMESIEHVKNAVQKNLPVLVIKGTGKAADLIAEYIADDTDKDTFIENRAPVLFGMTFEDDRFDDLKNTMKNIAERKWLINTFDVNNDDPAMLSSIAGEGIIRAWALDGTTKVEPFEYQQPQQAQQPPPPVIVTPQNPNLLTVDAALEIGVYSVPNDYDYPLKNGYPVLNKIHPIRYRQRSKTFVEPQNTSNDSEREVQTYIDNASHNYVSPTSLPLYFYFGYQYLLNQPDSNRNEKDARNLLNEALITNRSDYVRVLLDQGVQFTLKDLPKLYDKVCTELGPSSKTVNCSCSEEDDCHHVKGILLETHEERAKSVFREHEERAKRLVGEHEERAKSLFEEESNGNEVKKAAEGLCRSLLGYKEDKNLDDDSKDLSSDLLLWSIFANRKELAFTFWQKSDDNLLLALIATMVLSKLSQKAHNINEHNLSQEFASHAKLFEQRCLNMLDELYQMNRDLAMKIIDRTSTVWTIKTSPLTFAYENYMYNIVAHPCSQKHLNGKWYNGSARNLNSFLKSSFRSPIKAAKAPVTKYIIHYMLYVCMLLAYSAYVLTSVDDLYYRRTIARVWEYYIYIWALGDLIEELRLGLGIFQTSGKSHRGYGSRLKRYIYDFWNIVDLLSYALLVAALFVRHFTSPTDFIIARRLFSLSLIVMFIRFLQVFMMNKRLGPNLIMIKQMLVDMLYFLVIASVCVTGVGIYYHANLWPSHINIFSGDWTDWRIWDILYYPYWQLYGDSFLSYLEGNELDNCSNNSSVWLEDSSVDRCPEKDWSVIAVAGVYMLISNLLLVNLVIAMFSYTFDAVLANSDRLWKFEKYTVINDYDMKIPSPFNIPVLPLVLLMQFRCDQFCSNKCGCTNETETPAETKHFEETQKIIAKRLVQMNTQSTK